MNDPKLDKRGTSEVHFHRTRFLSYEVVTMEVNHPYRNAIQNKPTDVSKLTIMFPGE